MTTRLITMVGAVLALAVAPAPLPQAAVTPTGVTAATSPATPAKAAPIAARACAFRRLRPCPVDRARVFNLYGPYLDINARGSRFDMEIRDFTGVKDWRARSMLRRRRGASLNVFVTKRTRVFIVRPDHSRGRTTRKAFFTALNNYERAPVYVSGPLRPRSFWDDAVSRLRASLITLDLSDGAIANLGGEWRVKEDPSLRVTLTAGASGLRRYEGEVRNLEGTRVATVKVTQPTTGTVCIVDWIAVAGSGVPEHFDCGPISQNGELVGPMPARLPGRAPVTLTRATR